jgi:integrase
MRAAMQCNLPFVQAYRDRHGKWRYYVRRKGRKPVPIKGEPGSPEFLAAYQEALQAPLPSSPGIEAGTFEALHRDFLGSAEFSEFAEATRRELKYALAPLLTQHGPKRVAMLQRKHIQDWKDKLKTKPGACNKMLRAVKTILAYAMAKEYREDNPAAKIKLMKVGRHRAWTDEELRIFEAHWPVGTVERMIFDLAHYTGQRRSDLAKLRRDQIIGNNIRMTQGKTNVDLVIRIHENLAAALAIFLPAHKAETIIAGASGTALHPVTMAAIFRDACRVAGLPKACVLHGLRKTFARIMAELNQKSYPITGHKTRAMQEEYERDANQQKMGNAAILSWEKAARKRGGTK